MKKFVFTIGLVTLVTLSMAQRKELSNAYNHYSNKYWSRAKQRLTRQQNTKTLKMMLVHGFIEEIFIYK